MNFTKITSRYYKRQLYVLYSNRSNTRPELNHPTFLIEILHINKSSHSHPAAIMSLQHVTSLAQLEDLFAKNTYVAVDFFATWCPPCKAIAPVYEKLSEKHGADGHFAFAKVNVEEATDAAQKYGITAMPTFLFFKDGKQVTVNGQLEIKGANPPALTAAADKIGGLAAARQAAATETAA